jgi:competence protein ComEC
MAAYYAALVTIWRAPASRYGRRIARAAMVGTLAIVALAPALERTRPADGRLRISLLDVGQGDAILVQLPAGQSLLVDTGGSPGTFDIGSRVVTPAAWSLGVRTLTWLALTHGDRDHAGGAYGVTEDLQPREIWEGVPVPRHPALTALRDLAADSGVVWRTVLAGTRVAIGPVTIEALHPAAPDWERQKVRNDDSMVLRIQYGGVELLLTGDAGPEFEAHVPPDLADPPLRILKAGHHGSRTSTSDRLVAAMRPQVALISVGRGNLFGHPAADVIERLRGAGAEIFRTDRDGAISVETDGVTARILTALGRSWTIRSRGPS